MLHDSEELMAFLANDVFNKRQRLIKASQPNIYPIDDRTAQSLEAEYRIAQAEYMDAKAAFARAMKQAKDIA